MKRNKKELKQHHFAEFHKRVEEIQREYVDQVDNTPGINLLEDKSFWVMFQQKLQSLAKEYGINWKNKEQMGFYWSRVVNKPWKRINPKSDSSRRIRRSVIKHNIKPLKDRFKEELNDYDPDYDAFYYAYYDDNY